MEKPAGLLQAENTRAEKSVSDRLFIPRASSRLRKRARGKASTEIYGREQKPHMENGPNPVCTFFESQLQNTQSPCSEGILYFACLPVWILTYGGQLEISIYFSFETRCYL